MLGSRFGNGKARQVLWGLAKNSTARSLDRPQRREAAVGFGTCDFINLLVCLSAAERNREVRPLFTNITRQSFHTVGNNLSYLYYLLGQSFVRRDVPLNAIPIGR